MVEKSSSSISQYFQLIIERSFSEAEKKLEEVKQGLERSEKSEGYLKALEGLLLAYRSGNDRYLYLTNMELTGKNVEALKKEFTEQAESQLHADYDRGYFSALADFVRTISRLRPWRSKESGQLVEKSSRPSRQQPSKG